MIRINAIRLVLGLAVLSLLLTIATAALLITRAQPAGESDTTLAMLAGEAPPMRPLPVSPAEGPLGPVDDGRPRIGEPAPDFRLLTPDGQVVQLSALKGHVVVVNFWATWCGPCRQEFPEFERANREQASQEIIILAVNVGESGEKAAAYQQQMHGTFPIVLDSESAVLRQYGFRGIPDSVFIDRNGIVRDIVQGPISRGTLVYKLNQTLKASDVP
jgi:thiol-disulfide isomerase/thioredoxin